MSKQSIKKCRLECVNKLIQVLRHCEKLLSPVEKCRLECVSKLIQELRHCEK